MLERKDHGCQHHGRKRLSGTTKWLDRMWKSGDPPMTQEPQKPYTKRGGQHVQKAWLGAIAIVPTDRNQFLQDKKKTCPRTRAARKPHGSRLPPPPAEVAGQKKKSQLLQPSRPAHRHPLLAYTAPRASLYSVYEGARRCRLRIPDRPVLQDGRHKRREYVSAHLLGASGRR